MLQIYMCRSGSAADTQNLCSYVQNYLNQHCMSSGRDADVKTAAKLAQLIAYNNKVRMLMITSPGSLHPSKPFSDECKSVPNPPT